MQSLDIAICHTRLQPRQTAVIVQPSAQQYRAIALGHITAGCCLECCLALPSTALGVDAVLVEPGVPATLLGCSAHVQGLQLPLAVAKRAEQCLDVELVLVVPAAAVSLACCAATCPEDFAVAV